MRSYQAARGYFSFLSFVSWAAILGGAGLGLLLAAAVAETSRFGNPTLAAFLASTPGLILAAVGLFGLIFVQSSRAAVDSAEYAQQALAVSRNQLEVSRQLLKLAEAGNQSAGYTAVPKTEADLKSVSYDTEARAESAPRPNRPAIEHLGRKIEETAHGFTFEGRTFATLPEAKDHIRLKITEQQISFVKEKA